MKMVSSLSAAVLLFVNTAASAETWIEYDIQGVSKYVASDSSGDSSPGTVWTYGGVDFSATFFVEIEPGDGQSDDGNFDYSSDGANFTADFLDDDGPGTYSVGVTGSGLSFAYLSGECGTYPGCATTQIDLDFGAGKLTALPTAFPPLKSGAFTFDLQGRFTEISDAGGSRISSISAHQVGGPGTSGFDVSTFVPKVPEPASWAMMFGGFGLIGGALRRRRKAPAAAA